ncbi:MAG: hypothetical protein HYU71_06425 [Bacteroidetes bacterium]|nr:hypothetical protein [Bacteroidota bacterium]
MKSNNLPSPLPLLLLLTAILTIAFSSCGVTNKNRSSSSSQVDSSNTEVNKETDLFWSEAARKYGLTTKHSGFTFKIDSSYLKLRFYPSDSVNNTGPVVISQDSTGKTVIDPGGRKLKSVEDSRKKTTATGNLNTSVGNDSTVTSYLASKTRSDSSSTTVSKKAKTTEAKTFRWQPPWYAYPLVIAALLAIWKFRLYRRNKSEAVIPYSSPNDTAV